MNRSRESTTTGGVRFPWQESGLAPIEDVGQDSDSAAMAAGRVDPDCFCAECGQLRAGRRSDLYRIELAYPWWGWGLIAVGASLAILFGLTAWSSARDRTTAEASFRSLPSAEFRLEGPSSRRTAQQNEGPPGAVDRYLFANQQLNNALNETRFAIAVTLLGISLVARPAARRRPDGRVSTPAAVIRPVPLESVRHALLNGWALVETLAVAAFQLLTMGFLYFLGGSIGAGAPPTLDVLHDSLDRVIEMVTRLPDLVR